MPEDSVPEDSVPEDSVPEDSVPGSVSSCERHAEVVADASLRTPVAQALAGIRTRLAGLLADDPVCAGHDVDAIATAVVAVVQGGYVLARAADDRAPYDAAIEAAVALLRTLTHEPST